MPSRLFLSFLALLTLGPRPAHAYASSTHAPDSGINYYFVSGEPHGLLFHNARTGRINLVSSAINWELSRGPSGYVGAATADRILALRSGRVVRSWMIYDGEILGWLDTKLMVRDAKDRILSLDLKRGAVQVERLPAQCVYIGAANHRAIIVEQIPDGIQVIARGTHLSRREQWRVRGWTPSPGLAPVVLGCQWVVVPVEHGSQTALWCIDLKTGRTSRTIRDVGGLAVGSSRSSVWLFDCKLGKTGRPPFTSVEEYVPATHQLQAKSRIPGYIEPVGFIGSRHSIIGISFRTGAGPGTLDAIGLRSGHVVALHSVVYNACLG